eukprot:2579005-Prymnesium_polylepis.1
MDKCHPSGSACSGSSHGLRRAKPCGQLNTEQFKRERRWLGARVQSGSCCMYYEMTTVNTSIAVPSEDLIRWLRKMLFSALTAAKADARVVGNLQLQSSRDRTSAEVYGVVLEPPRRSATASVFHVLPPRLYS